MNDKITLKQLVDLYIKYGKKHGFFSAEFKLLKYLPKDNPFGVVADVPPKYWSKLAEDLSKQAPPSANLKESL